jgi:hypothetical protein
MIVPGRMMCRLLGGSLALDSSSMMWGGEILFLWEIVWWWVLI